MNGPVAEVCVDLGRPAFSLGLLKAVQTTKRVRDPGFILTCFMVRVQINVSHCHGIILLLGLYFGFLQFHTSSVWRNRSKLGRGVSFSLALV